MNKKVYAVNTGTQGGYRIVAVFTALKLANDFMKVVPDSEYNEIQEFELNPPTSNLIRRGYHVWYVHMLRNGDVEKVEKSDINSYIVTAIKHTLWQHTQAPIYRGKGNPDILMSTVWAKTREQAIKIVNGYRIQMILNGEWEV